ncbi:MAG: Flp pilus assembly protein CpaB [Actinomycetota bacterium]
MTTLVLGRRRTSRWGVIAVLAAVLTGLAVYSYLSWLRSQVPVAGRLVPIVVAATDIEPGIRVTDGMLEMVEHPSRYLPQEPLTAVDEAVGRLTTHPILAGEPVTGRKIGRNAGASGAVPEGMRAYGLNPQSLDGMALVPRSGDRVDVLATLAGEDGRAKTVTILTSVQVASSGGSTNDAGAGSSLVSSGRDRAVTLLVMPDQAEALAQAEAAGKITLVLVPTGLGE